MFVDVQSQGVFLSSFKGMYTERLRELVGSECSDLPLDTFDHNTNTISEVEPVDATSYRMLCLLNILRF